mmetsp:Transcript_53981/g.127474  ORF Transcript_53981/g.127474 Transcript_53981/m.127474 type:complete len:110 (+) Transcript_53981:1163-1492(+)
MRNLAACFANLDRRDLAEPLLVRLLHHERKLYGELSQQASNALQLLANLYDSSGESAHAATLRHQDLLALRARTHVSTVDEEPSESQPTRPTGRRKRRSAKAIQREVSV